MTKAKIVQRLLDKKQITAEEAVVLLKEDFNIPPSYPMYTPNPYYDTPNSTPPPIWCTTDTLNTPATGADWEYRDTKFTPPTEN
jgi:hypothetical protein|tara:strand:+ start:2977 stop:3228 length:252 start_codon:yes stop_codon:yes gene_type:complete